MTTPQDRAVRTVFVTGAAGYIGSVAARRFLEAGLQVVGVDNLQFGAHGLRELHKSENFCFINADIRRPAEWLDALAVCDAVLHLAAVVGDPACSQRPGLAESVNVDASYRLLSAAQKNGNTRRFIFASTCSNYGRQPDSEYCDETTELRPLSLYARTKVEVEQHILAAQREENFVPTCLRFATAFGLSPRMRFDLTVNEFTRELAQQRTLEIFGEQFWRPYCHTEDIADACLRTLLVDSNVVAHRAFNVGSTDNNHTKAELAQMLLARMPEADIEFVARSEDPRSYKVNCDRIARLLKFRPRHTVQDGIDEILRALDSDTYARLPETALRNTMAA